MARFHIVHVLRDDLPGLEAYQEVIDSVRWGLQQLGHDVSYGVNRIEPDARNILFGGHVSGDLVLAAPDDTIYYNLEQIRGHPQYNQENTPDLLQYVVNKFQIWDYSGANIPAWNRFRPKYPVRCMPVCYAPVLTHIKSAETQDIDVLVYGSAGERRLAVFAALARAKIATVFAFRIYGAGRDSLIARSKIVLNINHYEYAKIFEIVRVSYLMANSKAVIADVSPDTYIEADIPHGVTFVPIDSMVQACQCLLADEARRLQAERNGLECISKRDIRGFLAAALA